MSEACSGHVLAERMTRMLNDAALTMMIALGHELGLFDALDDLGEASSEQLASALGLNERQVREWLAALVSGGLIHYRGDDQRYWLPAEHAVALCRRGGASSWAPSASALMLLAGQREALLSCFRQGAALPQDAVGAYSRLVAQNTALVHEQRLLADILPLAPGLIERLEQGIEVAEIGCGYGQSLLLLAHAFPRSRFTGYDLDAEALGMARLEARLRGLGNLNVVERDAAALDSIDAYDLILAFDTVHELGDPGGALRCVARGLRPGGVFLMSECRAASALQDNGDLPLGPFLYAVSCLHCVPVALAQQGEALGAMWGEEQALCSLREAGLGQARVARLEGDALNNYFICGRA